MDECRLARDEKLGLTIHSVNNEDAGIWQCVVTKFSKQPTKPERGTSIKLVVNVSPTITYPEHRQSIYKKHGSDLNLECRAEGAPSPEITWSRNDQIISTSPVLKLSDLSESDKGPYTCLAVNIEGNSTSTFDLKFTKATTLDLIPTNKTVVKGSNVFWHCHANSQPGTIVYSWLYDKKPIKTTSAGLRANIRNGDLSLQDVRKTDTGWYSCEARNQDGETSSTMAFLQVLYSPEPNASHQPVQTIASGKNMTLSCDVSANPPPSVYVWSKNGHFLSSKTEDSIKIINAKPGDNGIYGCQAENIAGKGPIVETHIIVAEPPIFSVHPPAEMKVRQGEKLSIPCQGFGDPMPIVYWVRNKKRINHSTLNFKSIDHFDHGLYECIVANSVETIVTKMMLLVESTKPQPSTMVKFTCEGSSTMKISWTPGYNGGYDQTFAIHAQNEMNSQWATIKTSRSDAVLDHLEPFIAYKITIESSNVKGSTNSTTFNRRSCTSLHPPDKVYFCGYNEICWSNSEGASSYRIESLTEPSKNFQQVAEVFENYFRLDEKLPTNRPTMFRIRSIRPTYPPSEPSNQLTFGQSEQIKLPLIMLMSVFGIFALFILVIFVWKCIVKRNKNKKKKRKPSSTDSREYGKFTYGSSSSSQPGTETYYEPSIRLLDENSEWRAPPREMEPVCVRYPSFLEYDDDIGDENPIDDMFRDRYILSVQDPSPQLYQDLRLERLRREYKQSQI
ncbi:unnamed protein product [Caenorhabditis angaria]|uniref:Uncharacterized protein n=1 Tax=Caenorhabditis angaria TaxID=860376 RepID=A0A9P1J4B8_9PELO|nr:unnamed protein product [Caenorhabditis angaria]